MAQRIDTVEGRARLEPRVAPYWYRLGTGAALGYRRSGGASAGTWLVQYYDPATQKQTRRSLGSFDEVTPSQRFTRAREAADEWLRHLSRGGSADSMSVRQACESYIAHLRADGRDKTARDTEKRFMRWVYNDQVGSVDVRKLQPAHLQSWRRRLAGTDVLVNPHAAIDDQVRRTRAPSSLNRDMTSLRAALNWALDHGAATSDAAWRRALAPVKSADRSRGQYIDREERARLIEKARPDLGLFLRGLALLPLRPGALAALTVGSMEPRLSTLSVGQDKAGGDRKIKLPPATAAFFRGLCEQRGATAPLFARADGRSWNKDTWKKPLKEAALAAELPATVTAYSLRHSVITDLVVAGLDVLTVARLSGTSIGMIDKHYGHLRSEAAAAALANLAL